MISKSSRKLGANGRLTTDNRARLASVNAADEQATARPIITIATTVRVQLVHVDQDLPSDSPLPEFSASLPETLWRRTPNSPTRISVAVGRIPRPSGGGRAESPLALDDRGVAGNRRKEPVRREDPKSARDVLTSANRQGRCTRALAACCNRRRSSCFRFRRSATMCPRCRALPQLERLPAIWMPDGLCEVAQNVSTRGPVPLRKRRWGMP